VAEASAGGRPSGKKAGTKGSEPSEVILLVKKNGLW